MRSPRGCPAPRGPDERLSTELGMGETLGKSMGKPMENPWKTHGKPMENHGKPMENGKNIHGQILERSLENVR